MRLLPCAISFLLAIPAAGAELRSAQLPLELSSGWGLEKGDFMQLQLEATPRLELDLTAASGLTLSARLRVDDQDALEPGEPQLDNYAPASRPLPLGSAGTLELRDVYWEGRLERGILRLGKQQIVWGSLDGIKVLDVLNPQNFREFIIDDLGDSRISQWSAYLDFFMGNWRVETALIPDYSAHEIPEPGAWFELRAPRFRFGAPLGSRPLPTVTERGRDALDDAAFGLRLSRGIGRVDISAEAYSGNDHEPLGRLGERDQGLVLEQFYARRKVFGASAESSLGAFAFRAEVAYQPQRSYNTRGASGLGTVKADQASAGIAMDIDAPLGLLLNLQFLWDEVLDAPAGLVRPARDRVATFFLRRAIAYDTGRLEARWYHSLDDRDDLLKLSFSYDLGDNTSVYLSGDWFAGRRSGLFGQFAPQDRVVLGVRHTF